MVSPIVAASSPAMATTSPALASFTLTRFSPSKTKSFLTLAFSFPFSPMTITSSFARRVPRMMRPTASLPT